MDGIEIEDHYEELFLCAYRAALRVLADRDSAADVAAEAVARAFVRWRRVEGFAPAWVTRVAGCGTKPTNPTMRFPSASAQGRRSPASVAHNRLRAGQADSAQQPRRWGAPPCRLYGADLPGHLVGPRAGGTGGWSTGWLVTCNMVVWLPPVNAYDSTGSGCAVRAFAPSRSGYLTSAPPSS